MKKHLSFVLLLLFFFATGNQCVAQKDSLQPVTLQLDSARMGQFIKAIEEQTSLHFYYDPPLTDSLFITIHVQNEPVIKVFDAVLKTAGFFMVTDAEHHAFITKGSPLALDVALPPADQPTLSNNIGTPGGNQKRAAIEKENIRTTLENKVYEVGDKLSSATDKIVLSGTIKDSKTGETVAGAYVQADQTGPATTTDQYGYYTMLLPKGKHVIAVQSMSMKDTKRQIQLYGDGKLNIDMQSTILTIKNVVISAQKIE